MPDRIVIAGASGFIGSYLVRAFRAEGSTVSIIGRTGKDAAWGDTAAITALLDGALLINMAGKSVNCRYGPANREEIMRSRIQTTRELSDAIAACATPPALWINSSTATIYRHAEDRPMTESTGELGTGFSVGIAKAWEAELFAAGLPGTSGSRSGWRSCSATGVRCCRSSGSRASASAAPSSTGPGSGRGRG